MFPTGARFFRAPAAGARAAATAPDERRRTCLEGHLIAPPGPLGPVRPAGRRRSSTGAHSCYGATCGAARLDPGRRPPPRSPTPRPTMTTATAPTAAPLPIVSLRISARGLHDSWAHCRMLADYVAAFASSDCTDPEQLAPRLSNYVHELLEYVFHPPAPDGDVEVGVARSPERLLVELALPARDDLRDRLRRDVARAAGPAPDDDLAGLLELVVRHRVGLALREEPARCVVALSVPHA